MSMKRLIIFALSFLFICNIGFSAIPVIDFTAIATEAAKFLAELRKMKEILVKASDFKDKYLKHLDLNFLSMLGLDPDSIALLKMADDFYDFFKHSSYFQDLDELETWRDIFVNVSHITSRYPHIDKFDYYKKNPYYKNNKYYREITDKKIEMDKEKLKDLKNKLQLISDYREMDKGRIELFENMMKEWEEYSKGGDSGEPTNEAGLLSLIVRIGYERLLMTQQLKTLIRSEIESKIKSTTKLSEIIKNEENNIVNSKIDYKKLLKIKTK